MARSYSIALAALWLVTGCSQADKTYAVGCSSLPSHWAGRRIAHLRAVQPIYVRADGSALWNERVVSDDTLKLYLSKASAMDSEPQIVLSVAPAAACERVDTVRSIMNGSSLCNGPHVLCSEGSDWKHWPEDAGA